jgi:hypothetical protein|tara:strand:+ start:469 stop:1350 length:882 start_codon:yes stop_codon:yes gene_type:complete
MTKVQFWSEGTLLAGDLYYPPNWKEGERCPGIVICHGWGQSKDWGDATKPFQRHAERFAECGWVALAFDYRGWGESGARVVVKDDLPAEPIEVTARVQVIRQVVDPYDWAWDVRHALDFLEGEDGVDPERLALWGTSFAGGVVTWTAAHDARVKCVVSQVGLQDWSGAAADDPARAQLGRQRAIELARGEVGPIPQGIDAVGLPGTPNFAKMRDWSALPFADQIEVPVLLIDAEDEPLFDRHKNSELLYQRMQAAGRVPVEYRVLEGANHGQAYFERWQERSDLAVAWYQEHL